MSHDELQNFLAVYFEHLDAATLHPQTSEGSSQFIFKAFPFSLLSKDRDKGSFVRSAHNALRTGSYHLAGIYLQLEPSLIDFPFKAPGDVFDKYNNVARGSTTLLLSAINGKDLKGVEFLLARGASVSVSVPKLRLLPLTYAISIGAPIAIMRLLLDAGASLTTEICPVEPSEVPATALNKVESGHLPVMVLSSPLGETLNPMPTIRLPLTHDAEPEDIKVGNGRSTASPYSGSPASTSIVEFLLDEGARPSESPIDTEQLNLISSANNRTAASVVIIPSACPPPLHSAVVADNIALAERLLRLGADPFATIGANQWTALHLTAMYKRPNASHIAKLLLEAVGGIECEISKDAQPLSSESDEVDSYASSQNYSDGESEGDRGISEDLYDTVLTPPQPPSRLPSVESVASISIATPSLSSSRCLALLNKKAVDGMTPLRLAYMYVPSRCGSNYDYDDYGNYVNTPDRTPFAFALVKMLVDFGADVNTRDEVFTFTFEYDESPVVIGGWSLLNVAKLYGNRPLFHFLRACGCEGDAVEEAELEKKSLEFMGWSSFPSIRLSG